MIGVAEPVEMGEDGNAALALHPLDQPAPAPGHDHIDAIGQAQQRAHRPPVGGGQSLDRILRQSRLGERAAQAGEDRRRGMPAFRAAAQDRGIAGAQAQRPGIGGHIGPGFIDDSDDAQRHGDPRDMEAVGPRDLAQGPAHGIGQGSDGGHPGGHGLHAPGIEAQAIEQGGGQALLLGRGHILLIGLDQPRARGADRGGGGHKGAAALLGGALGETGGGGLGALADLADGPLDLGAVLALRRVGCVHRSTTRSSRWIISSRPR